jgi:lysophospholipase L1-like esterase
LASLPPSRRQWQDHISELNSLIREYCARTRAIYLDYYLALAEGGNLKKYLTDAGVLPNEAGYAVMALLVEKAIAEAIEK